MSQSYILTRFYGHTDFDIYILHESRRQERGNLLLGIFFSPQKKSNTNVPRQQAISASRKGWRQTLNRIGHSIDEPFSHFQYPTRFADDNDKATATEKKKM